MDPLKINPYLNELILQHLDVSEILNLSTLSKSWHREIGTSKTCMKKLKLSLKYWKSINKQQQQVEKIDLLKNITRNFQHITIDCRFDKNLSMEFWSTLEYLANTLITLKIKSIKIENPTSIHLPKLQELKLVYVPINVRNVLMRSSCVFKSLKLKLVSPLNWMKGNSPPDLDSVTSISTLLDNNEKLESLELHGGVQYSYFFDKDISELTKFKLKNFKIKSDMRLSLISEKTENNLIKFLTTQSSSLESIFIDVCRQHVIEHIFNQMPHLETIKIETVMTEFSAKDLKLKLNERVVNLHIPYISRHDDIREILAMTPNLQTLFVAHLSHETMSYIAWNLQRLTTLKYRYDEIDCELLYERLKDDNEEVNQNIEMIVDYEYS